MSHALQALLAGSAALVDHGDDDREEEEMGEPVEATRGHRIDGGNHAIFSFALAGNARFTLVSKKTGARFTFRVAAKRDERSKEIRCWFVSVLSGPDNGADYAFLGTIFANERIQIGGGAWGPAYGTRKADRPKFVHGKKSRISSSAPSAKAFAWWWSRITAGEEPESCEVWHLGKCGRCGRDLTVPESIACGLGPECASKMEGR